MEEFKVAFSVVNSFCSRSIVSKFFFFYIEDFFKGFLLTNKDFRYFGFTLLLIQWGSDDQTLDNFRKLFIKNIGCIK